MNKLPVLSGTVLLLLVGAQSANAANFLDTCNGRPMGLPNASVAWSVSSAGFPAGGTWDTALRAAIARVNDNPSRLRMSIANNSDTSVAIGNGQNEIWFSANASEASPAVTYNYYDCNTATGVGVISETDVLFYNGEPYTADMTVNARLYGYGGSLRPFQTTAVHEFGHALGLAHSNTEYNIMGTDFYFMTTNAGVGRAYLGADASDGTIRIYGAGPQRQDVSLSHWKYSGASGAYSSHAKTILASASGTELASTVDAGEKRYAVTSGQTVQLELTRENSGQSAQSARIGYYLSTDNRIDAADRQLAVETLNVVLGDPTTWRRTLTLPTGLATGKYWLGAIIDDNNAIAEQVEDNNAMYIPVSYTGGGGGGNQPPAASFTTAISGLTVTFTDGSTDTDGSIASRSWSFGDGTTSTAVNPTKTYAAAGTYTVSLTVTDNQGATNTTSRSVTVSSGGGGGLPECTATRTDELGRNCSRSNLSASAGSTRYFYLLVPAGTTQLRITTTGGTGNADLYYSASSWATPTSYTLRSVNAGNGESITVSNPPGGYVYISVHAATAFSGVKVSTEY